MNNKETVQNNNERLSENNNDLNNILNTINNLPDKVDIDLSEMATKDDVKGLYNTSLPVGEIKDGYYINGTNGGEKTDASSSVTDFIEVNENTDIKIENVYIQSNRSVSVYNSEKKFMKALATASTNTTVEVSIPNGGKYIRITGKAGVTPVATLINYPIERHIINLEEKLNSVDTIASKLIKPIQTIKGKYFSPTGVLTADDATTISYIIPVIEGEDVVIEGVNAGGTTRAVVALDGNKNFVKEIPTTAVYTAQTLNISVEGFSYIGVSTKDTFVFKAQYDKHYTTLQEPLIDDIKQNITNTMDKDDSIGNYVEAEITVNTDEFSEGYVYWNDTISESTAVYHSHYIEVLENQEVELKYYYSAAQVTAYFYDENKNLIEYLKDSTKGANVVSCKFVTPFRTRYIRYNAHTNNLYRTSLAYTHKIERNYLERSIVNGWYNDSYNKIGNLFANATKKPIITFIDDDTSTLASTKLYHDACVNLGIKGCFAVITGQLNRIEGLAEQLLEYEKDGFHMITHCSEQSGHITLDDGTKTSAYLSESRDLALCEKDLVNAMQKMKKHGFTDYKFWCTPYGVCDEDMQNLARKWGMECLVSSGRNEYETTEAKYGRFAIRRISFEATDEEAGVVSLEKIKTHIDNAVAEKGWVLITTHFMESAWANNLDRFAELVNYAKEKGMEVKTLNEAYRIREPIYKLYEMF